MCFIYDDAAQRIKEKIHDDYFMQINEFMNNEQIKLFHQLFYQPEYREISQITTEYGFMHSNLLLNKMDIIQISLIFLIILLQLSFLGEICYIYNNRFLKRVVINIINVNKNILNSINIQNSSSRDCFIAYFILDVLLIMDQFQLKIELKQISNQFFLVIQANSINSVDEILEILENNLIKNNSGFQLIQKLNFVQTISIICKKSQMIRSEPMQKIRYIYMKI
ncbi:unnamed protein product [Paramecium sonneborni]|uniref:Transmembrane protein n=1 Tax=Paramecium sonneborni TaxID=65129 RepID=A0A8S1R5R8_9CILI|nr:unnamed protein product [Paramecium sonneborni]